jgi:hypothetical protein
VGKSAIWTLLRRGRRAVPLMTSVYPVMGERRRTRIDRALATVDPD